MATCVNWQKGYNDRMVSVAYTPKFVREFKKLNTVLKNKVISKINLFKKSPSNQTFRLHKLHGDFSDCWAFSIDYKHRMVFKYLSENEVIFIVIGDHSIYK